MATTKISTSANEILVLQILVSYYWQPGVGWDTFNTVQDMHTSQITNLSYNHASWYLLAKAVLFHHQPDAARCRLKTRLCQEYFKSNQPVCLYRVVDCCNNQSDGTTSLTDHTIRLITKSQKALCAGRVTVFWCSLFYLQIFWSVNSLQKMVIIIINKEYWP